MSYLQPIHVHQQLRVGLSIVWMRLEMTEYVSTVAWYDPDTPVPPLELVSFG